MTCKGVELLLGTVLTSALDGGEWPGSRLGRFTAGNITVLDVTTYS
jgi:hypothetical protein